MYPQQQYQPSKMRGIMIVVASTIVVALICLALGYGLAFYRYQSWYSSCAHQGQVAICTQAMPFP